jgi:hypothetical protein
MPTNGLVVRLQLGRTIGKVTVRNFVLVTVTGKGTSPDDVVSFDETRKALDHPFALYNDGDATMIDPTEMVRRNWFIGLLQRALAEQLPVTILHNDTDFRVRGVVLRAPE